MIVGGIGKAALYEYLSATAVFSCPTAVSLRTRAIQEFLMLVPLNRAPGLRAGALLAQSTLGVG